MICSFTLPLPKDSLLQGDKELMKLYNDVKLINVQFVASVDPVTYNIDVGIMVYGIWVSKFATISK